jgi:ketosteroid isomerase-like protein
MTDVDPAADFAAAFQAFNERRFSDFAGYVTEDVVEEYPQSDERIEGRETQRHMHEACPVPPTFTIREVRHAGNLAVVELDEAYPDGSIWRDVFIFELRDGKVARMTGYFSEPFEAPEWRRQYTVSD